MVRSETDTIVAKATASGLGSIGVVRVSGPKASAVAKQVLGIVPKPRQAEYRPFKARTGEVLDLGVALYFQAPHSFTGEDVLELQGHGGAIVLNRILDECLQAGARLAEPGEFSLRAFLNDKIDLVQAESIADLISAQSEHAARGALRSLQGAFSQSIEEMVQALMRARVWIESMIDFSDEDIDRLTEAEIEQHLLPIQTQLEQALSVAEKGARVSEGFRLAIVGKPNAGKSSLFNALTLNDLAIVTDIPGTTRDVLKEQILVDGLTFELVDTAGIRITDNPIELEGIKRATRAIQEADHVLLVVDSQDHHLPEALLAEQQTIAPDQNVTIFCNKIDKTGLSPQRRIENSICIIYGSLKTGAGVDLLQEHLHSLGGTQGVEHAFGARKRHVTQLEKALEATRSAIEVFSTTRALELCAEELRVAQLSLEGITGKVSSDDLLGEIFSTFCIGK